MWKTKQLVEPLRQAEMGETLAQEMPSAVLFGRLVRGRGEGGKVEFDGERNVDVYSGQTRMTRRRGARSRWRGRLTLMHGRLGFGLALGGRFGRRLALGRGWAPPARSEHLALEDCVELRRQPICPLPTSWESTDGVGKGGQIMPFEQLARCQEPVLLPQCQRLQKMIGVILTVALREPLQEHHSPISAPVKKSRGGRETQYRSVARAGTNCFLRQG